MITDFAVLDEVLSAIQDASTGMALLHREGDVANHAVDSDVDVCVAGDPLTTISSAALRLGAEGVLLILVFHYDRGSYSYFFANSRGTGGAQVDVLHDPNGTARYGVRTDALLAKSMEGVRWPRVDALDEALYVLRKRHVKGDPPGVASARRALAEFESGRIAERTMEIFGRRAATDVIALLRGEHPRTSSRDLWRSRLMRPSRIFRRCGYWARIVGDSAPVESGRLADRMSRIVTATTTSDPSLGFLLRNLWRPRLVLSAGESTFGLRPNVVLESGRTREEPDDLTTRLVAAMHAHVVSTFQLDRRATHG